MQRVGAWLGRWGLDLVLVLLVVEGLFGVANRDSGPTTSVSLASGLAVVLLAIPLFARHWLPFAGPVLVWALGAGISFVEGTMITALFGAYFIGGAAAFFLGNHPVASRARLGLLIVLVGSAIVVYNDPNHVTADYVTIPATFAVAWLAGMAIRTRVHEADEAERRAAVLARERESATRLAVAEERSRIARELHDVVAHSMSVMVLQVGAVRHRLPESLADDRTALEAVERTGRGALTEMRRLLGVIDGDIDADLSPQPGLDRLEALVEEVGRAGLPVDLHVDGEAEAVPRGIDLSAYRIIQEGLTNCLKHANATRAGVTVAFGGDDLSIEVEDDGRGPGPGDGAGRGLTGIRERVKIYGGEMSAGPRSGGGYRLEVRLPLRAPR